MPSTAWQCSHCFTPAVGPRAEINSAVDVIEFRLQRFPMAFANEISEGLWRIDVDPVGITFTIAGKDITIESIGWIS